MSPQAHMQNPPPRGALPVPLEPPYVCANWISPFHPWLLPGESCGSESEHSRGGAGGLSARETAATQRAVGGDATQTPPGNAVGKGAQRRTTPELPGRRSRAHQWGDSCSFADNSAWRVLPWLLLSVIILSVSLWSITMLKVKYIWSGEVRSQWLMRGMNDLGAVIFSLAHILFAYHLWTEGMMQEWSLLSI